MLSSYYNIQTSIMQYYICQLAPFFTLQGNSFFTPLYKTRKFSQTGEVGKREKGRKAVHLIPTNTHKRDKKFDPVYFLRCNYFYKETASHSCDDLEKCQKISFVQTMVEGSRHPVPSHLPFFFFSFLNLAVKVKDFKLLFQ